MSKTYLVIGAAKSGVSVTKALLELGHKVILTDNRNRDSIIKEFPQVQIDLEALSSKDLELFFGDQFPIERINELKCIVISPGVPLTIPIVSEANKMAVPVMSEVELAYELSQTPFIAITGTNGKTTTTTLTGEIFKRSQRQTFIVGNIGDPITNYIGIAKKEGVYVTEISSFQLETCHKFHPKVAAILNLSPDHLDRHLTLEAYYDAKARIFMNQTEEDILVLNQDDKEVCRIGEKAKSHKVYFSLEKPVLEGAYADKDSVYLVKDGKIEEICNIEEIGIKGPHNIANALAAIVLSAFSGVNISVIKKVLAEFKGVSHRQERFVTIDGVDYINDSKGTNTNATITALNAMTKPTILLAGGYDKNENYTELMALAKEKIKGLVLVGVTAKNMKSAAIEQGISSCQIVDDFETAVKCCCDLAETGDVVLLSPACASWDMFNNYKERGEVFKELVHKYGHKK